MADEDAHPAATDEDQREPSGHAEGATGNAVPRVPAYRIPTDEEIVAAAVQTVLANGTIDSQRKLGELVMRRLRKRDPKYRVSPERIRVLALKSGLIGVKVHAHPREGEPPERLKACPVCGNALERTSNATLEGGAARTGYKCTRCPWWTGRDYRVPSRYVFHSLVERDADAAQLRFRE